MELVILLRPSVLTMYRPFFENILFNFNTKHRHRELEFIKKKKESKKKKKVRKKERKHALDQESDQVTIKTKRKFLDLKISINFMYFQSLLLVSVICRLDQTEYISKMRLNV